MILMMILMVTVMAAAVREEAEVDGGQPRLLEDVVRGKPVGNNGPVLGGGQVPR